MGHNQDRKQIIDNNRCILPIWSVIILMCVSRAGLIGCLWIEIFSPCATFIKLSHFLSSLTLLYNSHHGGTDKEMYPWWWRKKKTSKTRIQYKFRQRKCNLLIVRVRFLCWGWKAWSIALLVLSLYQYREVENLCFRAESLKNAVFLCFK